MAMERCHRLHGSVSHSVTFSRVDAMRKGFSLAELLLTIALMSIASVIALPRVAAMRDRLAVHAAATDVLSALHSARQHARFRALKKPVLGKRRLKKPVLGKRPLKKPVLGKRPLKKPI